MDSALLADITERLNKLNIFDLRQVARAVGVHRPADGKKSRVLNAILDIAKGVTPPEPPSLRGAPPKSKNFDEQLVADIKACRRYCCESGFDDSSVQKTVMSVGSSAQEGAAESEKLCAGVLDKSGKYAFLRINGALQTPEEDVFVHESFISRFGLREGDFISGKSRRLSYDSAPGLTEIISINGCGREIETRRDFSKLTRTYPRVTVKTAVKGEDTACRITDMFAPLSSGQRSLIVSPVRCGKTFLIKLLAAGIIANNPETEAVFVIIDAKPEEETFFKRNFKEGKLFFTTFGMSAENHIRTVKLATEYAKRLTELGKDAIIFLDGLTSLARAYNAVGHNADEELKNFLSCALNAEEGGSLTILATLLSDSYNAFDNGICSELYGLGDMVLKLSSELAAKRIFPAIEISSSYTNGVERLQSAEELAAATALRGKSDEEIIRIFRQTSDNSEIIEKFR